MSTPILLPVGRERSQLFRMLAAQLAQRTPADKQMGTAIQSSPGLCVLQNAWRAQTCVEDRAVE